jgi:MFS family permease
MAVFYGWWIVLACFILSFYMAGTVFYSFTAFMEPLVAEFGWSYTQISIAASLRGLEMGIFAPIVGIFVDRFGSRIVIFLGVTIVGFSMILLSMTNSLIMFYGASLLLGLGAGGCTSVVVMTAVANWFNRKVSLALGITACGFGSGGLLVPVLVWMIARLNWRVTLLILGLTAWALCLPLSLVIRSKPEKYGYLPDGEEIHIPTSGSVEQGMKVPLKVKNIPFNKAIKDSNFWYFNMAEAIRMMILVTIIMHVMPYLKSLGVPRTTAGLVTGAIAMVSVVGRLGFGYLGDFFDKRYITAASYALMTLGLVVFSSFIKGPWSLLVFLLLFAPGFGGGMTMRGSLLREYFGTFSYGKILGLTMGVGSMAALIGPTLAGWVFDTLGSYRPLWLSYIGLNMVAILLISGIKPLKA